VLTNLIIHHGTLYSKLVLTDFGWAFCFKQNQLRLKSIPATYLYIQELSTKRVPVIKASTPTMRTLDLANLEYGPRAEAYYMRHISTAAHPHIHKVTVFKWYLDFGHWHVVLDRTYTTISSICGSCIFIPISAISLLDVTRSLFHPSRSLLWSEFYLRAFIPSASYKPLFLLRYPELPIYYFLDHTIFKSTLVSPASDGLYSKTWIHMQSFTQLLPAEAPLELTRIWQHIIQTVTLRKFAHLLSWRRP
jgi:hypothetical protein